MLRLFLLVQLCLRALATEFECIILSISCTLNSTSPDLTVLLFYRPPSSNPAVLDVLFSTMCNLDVSVFDNFYIIGDFNIDFICANTSLYHKLLSVMSSFNLTQIVTEPTRITSNSATLIDLIFVATPTLVKSCLTIPPLSNSDHNGLQLLVTIKSPKRSEKPTPRKIWKYALANFDSITSRLENTDWDKIFLDDVDTCWNNWKNYFLSVMDKFIPHSMVSHDERLPWINYTVLKAIRKRKTLFRLYKRTGNQFDHDKYKHQRNTVVSLLRLRKEKFFKNLNPSNAKDFWKAVKKLNSKSITIPTLSNNGQSVCTSQGKAKLINDFFFGCFNRQYPPLGSVPSPLNYYSNLDPQEFPEKLLCSEDTISDMLANLDSSKSTGADDISARMLKANAYSIAPSLTKLFNLSLTTGTVPNEWKVARIVPIPKTDCPSASTSGYRPISVLPIISKVLERHVKELIDDCIADNAPISKYQWGFMHHRSSTSALISVFHDWLCSLDSGKEICVVFFDVKKAFDSVPHIPLLPAEIIRYRPRPISSQVD